MTQTKSAADILERARAIKLAIFDVDGVLTDGSLMYTETGETIKVFNTLDGHGLKMLQQAGVEVAIISGRASQALTLRMRELGITHVFQGVQDKLATFEALTRSLGVTLEEVASIGDDVMDLPILTRCGFAAAVPAAPAFVRERVHHVTLASGGRGAAREFCEIILQAQGKLDALLKRYVS